MALVAMSVQDTIKYVSNLDPAKSVKQVPVDEAAPDGPTKDEETIDWDSATVFELGALDVHLMSHIYDDASRLVGREGYDEVSIKSQVNATNVEAVRYGLKGWKNFKDEKGNDVRFTTVKRTVGRNSYTVVSDESLNALGIYLIGDIAQKIKAISQVTPAQAKN